MTGLCPCCGRHSSKTPVIWGGRVEWRMGGYSQERSGLQGNRLETLLSGKGVGSKEAEIYTKRETFVVITTLKQAYEKT